MSGFIITLLIVLVFIIIYQIGKASEYASAIRGEEKVKYKTNRVIGWLLVAFFFLGMYGIYMCHMSLKDKMLPVSASEYGVHYDSMFITTLWVTGIVFFATQAVLFYFAWKYQSSEKNTRSTFFSHSNKLEVIWTTIPAVFMAVLVAIGLKNWAAVTSDAPTEANVVEIVGKQFNWIIRYPGKDNQLGKRDFRKINDANNLLGLDWKDPATMDDIISASGELHVVVNKPVKLLIGSRDVIHDVGLPHFRMKMDAVPGITSTLWFLPTITTDSMKLITGNKDFTYEIACDQMCGKGHYSMRGTIIVQTQAEYDKWLASQKSYYASNQPESKEPAAEQAKVEGKDGAKADTIKKVTMR